MKFGYYKKVAGNCHEKIIYDDEIKMPVVKDGLIFIDIATIGELDAVPMAPEIQMKVNAEKLIIAKIRELAIIELKKEGKLPPDYEEVTQ